MKKSSMGANFKPLSGCRACHVWKIRLNKDVLASIRTFTHEMLKIYLIGMSKQNQEDI